MELRGRGAALRRAYSSHTTASYAATCVFGISRALDPVSVSLPSAQQPPSPAARAAQHRRGGPPEQPEAFFNPGVWRASTSAAAKGLGFAMCGGAAVPAAQRPSASAELTRSALPSPEHRDAHHGPTTAALRAPRAVLRRGAREPDSCAARTVGPHPQD
eukprot:scaffold7863_cov277-Pinguiococcus_pyrenoidosus.AAC.2